MNECVEYLELISAYADDELTESEKRRVKEHLDTCESCSALLELYREISVAAAESSEPAPAELLSGVMEKVRHEGKTVKSDNANRRRIIRLALTRYVPVAACLAVMLLTLPRVMSNNRLAYDMTASMPNSAQAEAMPAMGGAPSMRIEMAMTDEAIESEEDTANSSARMQGAGTPGAAPAAPGSGSAPAPIAPGGVAPAPEAAQGGAAGSALPPRGEAPASTADHGSYNESFNVPPATIIQEEPPSAGAESQGEAQSPGSYAHWGQPSDGNDIEDGAIEDLDDFMPVAVPYFAIIEIIGELPEQLEDYEAVQIDDFTQHIVIPHNEAMALIPVLTGRAGITISVNIEGGDYALVIFTRQR